MITAGEAREAARRALALVRLRDDAMSAPWRAASLGEPFLVRSVERQPSFWIVPVMLGQQVLGTIEIGLEGGVRGESFFYSSPDAIDECPTVATRIGAEEAFAQASPLLERYREADIAAPVYVLDAERGRLAWMIEVTRRGKLLSRIFATPGYAWEWTPGGPLGKPGVRG